MKILMVYPKHPESYWSFSHALKFISKKASFPPLGLLTVAAMLPEAWSKKLVDENVDHLKDEDLRWADYVFISAISIQRETAKQLIARCNQLGAKVVAGGPLFTAGHAEFTGVDHFVLNEAELTLPLFLKDLAQGQTKPLYTTDQWVDLAKTPTPLWSLVDMRKYATMSIQHSRGCPFNCDFCDITSLFGRATRNKSAGQIVAELETLFVRGWKGGVFFVDDNFIGNKRHLKESILPAIADWMERHKHPFTFLTQASINLADDQELLTMMVAAGFITVFVGIESPNEDSLAECSKHQNKGRDLVASVKRLQQAGLQVQGGFIIGFDQDPPNIFERQIKFIQTSGIVTAMVGLLNAVRGTQLYQRLENENRLIKTSSGNNTDCSINFIPKMNLDTLLAGYKRIVSKIYSPAYYYARVKNFLREYKPLRKSSNPYGWVGVSAFFKSVVLLGVIGKERLHYWELLLWSLVRRPAQLPMAVAFAISGYHYRKVFEKLI